MPAQLWKKLSRGRVQCRLCGRFCVIAPGERGFCGVRANDGKGALHSLVEDGIGAINLDPVEKKPLYHYLPATRTLSFGTPGCNFACAFCQNSALAHGPRESGRADTRRVTPDDLIEEARRAGAASVSFTYNEPTVFFELMLKTADRALEAGLGSVLVSNGFQSPQCLAALRGRIRAANIDLKSFRDAFYREHCRARLAPVLANLRRMREFGWWLEVTTLLVPGCNDGPEEVRDIARFLARDLGGDVPWHISRFHPAFRMKDRSPTTLGALEAAAGIGREEGVRFVYLGNVPGHPLESTFCPRCGRRLIARRGYAVDFAEGGPFAGRCGCGERIPGVWRAA
jgi:pyruvate formate lyase activating enzyme